MEAPKVVCATIMVESGAKKTTCTGAEIILDRIASSLYERCRLKTSSVSGFPDFVPLVSELNASTDESGTGPGDAFKVTTLHPSGNLIIQEQFFQQFAGEESAEEFDKMVDEHNEKYNAENLRMNERASPTKKTDEIVKMELVAPEDGKEPSAETIAGLQGASSSQSICAMSYKSSTFNSCLINKRYLICD